MPRSVTVTFADGSSHVYNGVPDNAQPQDVIARAAKDFGGQQIAHLDGGKPAPDQTSAGGRLMQGLGDPVIGGSQLAARMADPEAAMALNQAGLNPQEILAPKNTDQYAQQREKAYQQSRGANAGTFDPLRLAGNVVATAPLAAVAPAATTLPGIIGSGALAGGATAALQPVTGDNFAAEKAKQVGLGALTGGGTAGVLGTLGRIVRPNVSPDVAALQSEGVTPTPGQIGGTAARTVEKLSEHIPLVGNMPIAAEQRTLGAFNKATINQVLRPIGETLPEGTAAGNAAVDQAKSLIGKAFDDAYGRLNARATPEFVQEVASAGAEVPENFAKEFTKRVSGQFGKLDPTEEIAGRTLAKSRDYFANLATRYGRDPGAEQQMLGEAYGKVVDAIDNMMSAAHPNETGVQAAKQSWAMFLRARAAASMAPQDGVFSPGQLAQAVRRYGGEDAFARGQALMQPWAQSALRVMGNAPPRQGGSVAGGILGAFGAYHALPYMLEPSGLATAGGTAALYSPLGQRAFSALMTQRPDIAVPIANAIRGASPYAASAAANIANESPRERLARQLAGQGR